ncbi:hypothetical protein ACMYYO_00010 [Dermacoccaceae bacterium W4C1]
MKSPSTLCALSLAVSLSIAACGSSDETSSSSAETATPATSTSTSAPVVSTSTAEVPKTLVEATKAAQEVSDRFSSGDFAGSWMLMSKDLRSKISKADYVTLSETCSNAGLPIKATGVRMEGDSTAIVRLEVAGYKQARTMVYEDGAWYQQATKEFAAELGKPVNDVIASLKKSGQCDSDG